MGGRLIAESGEKASTRAGAKGSQAGEGLVVERAWTWGGSSGERRPRTLAGDNHSGADRQWSRIAEPDGASGSPTLCLGEELTSTEGRRAGTGEFIRLPSGRTSLAGLRSP